MELRTLSRVRHQYSAEQGPVHVCQCCCVCKSHEQILRSKWLRAVLRHAEDGNERDELKGSCTACIAGAVAAAEELQGFVCRVPLPEQAISTAAVYEDASLPEALRQQVRGAALHDH